MSTKLVYYTYATFCQDRACSAKLSGGSRALRAWRVHQSLSIIRESVYSRSILQDLVKSYYDRYTLT